jgi:uncharacterized protein YoxC
MLKNSLTQNVHSENHTALGIDSGVSELDIQASYLSESLNYLASNIEQLNIKLSPILRSCPVTGLSENDIQEPTSSLGNFIHSAAKDVNKLNNQISQILQALAI